MKKLLLLALLLPIAAMAQRKQLGINAGTQIWTATGAEVYGSLRFMADQEMVFAGLAMEGGSSAEQVSYPYKDAQGQYRNFTDRAKVAYFFAYGFANYKMPFYKRLYAGGSLGYFVLQQDAYYYKVVNAAQAYNSVEKTVDTRKTVALGFQIGYNADISQRLSFNAEAGFRFVPLPMSRKSYMPLSIGLRYNIY